MDHPACPACAAALTDGARFCAACGAIVERAPITPADDLQRGLIALRNGDLDRALPLLETASRDGDGFALLAYGTALLRRRRYDRAMAPLEQAAAALPDRGEPLAYLGMARLHTLDPIGAREALDRALAIAPQSFAVHLKQAEFLFRLGYYREARAAIEQTLALRAPDAESLAFAERLSALARQKAPQAYTRQPGRLPRLTLPFLRRRTSRQPLPAARPQTSAT